MSLLVYAKSEQEYEDAKGAMLEKIGGNETHPLYKTFEENWDNSQDQWVSYKRGNVPHLTNNTNNRIESKSGKIKDVIKDTFTIDELVSTLITLQEYTEEQYIAEYNRVGGRSSGLNENPEIASLALQISEFALKPVSEEHALATGPDADYTVNIGSAATATVTSGRTASTYEVDTARSHCSKCNYETVIPPMHFFSTRLIVHSPVNNITEGEVSPGGLRQVSCGPLPSDKALSSSSKYIDAKALAEKIVDRIALQSTPTYRVALQWLQDFYEARNAGTVMSFAEEESSQVLGPSDGEQPSTKVEEQVGTDDQVDNALEADDHQGDIHADNQVNQEDLNGGKDAEAEKKSTERAEKDDEPNETKNAPKTQKNQSDSEKKSGVVTWKFADRPLVNGMTKAQRKRAKAKAKENHLLARALAAK
ncbi:hypothetical protein PC116_g26445 [Phytophthora cactorum]|uniref:Uncharacterized protein n=2 Tax=Phytophthora cactorum TaxID=29920 RepID=A0A8T0YX46_9STRA|nr:hypothetical protein PC113_g13473 [Phytophthora cactorum]KAG2961319.1 hypothetical protein PC118_g22036 [Phytophthora cactorum]KAG4225114.1 hypothetical protein PC116_g26445 [Phytophthora cactorum]